MKRSRIDMTHAPDLGEAIDAMRKRTVSLAWLAALTGLLALTSCDSSTSGGMGTVRLSLASSGTSSMLTAAALTSFDDVTSATVTITRAELMPGHVEIDLGASEVTFDLLDLEGDVTVLLGTAPALGEYEQLRLFVSEASVTLASGSTFDLRVPSGAQTGIKVNFAGPIEVGPGATVDLLAVFDVNQSFVFQGPPDAPRSVSFKPVIHASTVEAASIGGQVTVNRPAGGAAATVSVTVTASGGGASASVSVDVILAAAATTATSDYLLRFLQPDVTYAVTASATGFPTVAPATADVAAAAGLNTGPNFTLAP
jgi:hypothetical protein